MSDQTPTLLVALLAGGATGTTVDSSLHPIDTIKTRLQSPQGLWKAGGFRGIFSGIVPVLVVTAPNSALFFGIYEGSKLFGDAYLTPKYDPAVMVAGSTIAQMVCLTFYVPAEIIKQRAQASRAPSLPIFKEILRSEGLRGFYRGFVSTALRDAPFAVLQFPLWDLCKRLLADRRGRPVNAWESGLCGAAAGGVAAVATTPMDVIKTRIMLGEKTSPGKVDRIPDVFRTVLRERGVPGLFAGVVPRFLWITVGGFYYLALYEKIKIETTKYMYGTSKNM